MRGLLSSARARGATCQLRPPTPSQRFVSRAAQALCSLSLGRRRSTRAWCVRAPCHGGYDWTCSIEGHCADERSLSFCARPWCVVPAAPSNATPAPRVSRSAGALCSLSLGRRRSSRACCCARAMLRWLWSAISCRKALRQRTVFLHRRAPAVRRASCDLQRQASAACHAAHARRHSLSLGRRRTTRACCVRAPYRADCGRPMRCERALRWREASFLRRAPVARRARCGVRRQAGAACHVVHARRRSLSLGRRRATPACCARAPCWGGFGRPTPYERAPRWRKASLLRRTLVVRRASCDL